MLIRPKRSTLGSAKKLIPTRGYTFRNYKPVVATDVLTQGYPADPYVERHWRGVPIMASNMDGVGTFEIADVLGELGLFFQAW